MTRTIKIIISIIATIVDFIIIMPLAALAINNGYDNLGLQIFLAGPIVTGIIALLLSGGLLTTIKYIFDFGDGEYPLLAFFVAIVLKIIFVILFPVVVALDTARDNKESNYKNSEFFEDIPVKPEEKKRKIKLKNDGSFEDMLRMAGVDVDE